MHQIGTPDEIYSRPATAFVASFIGEMNFLRGRLAPDAQEGAAARVGAHTLHASRSTVAAGAAEKDVLVCIRTERVQVNSHRRTEHEMPGIVRRIVYRGTDYEVTCSVEDQELRAVVSAVDWDPVSRQSAPRCGWASTAATSRSSPGPRRNRSSSTRRRRCECRRGSPRRGRSCGASRSRSGCSCSCSFRWGTPSSRASSRSRACRSRPRCTLKNYALFFTDPMYSGILLKSMLLSLAIAVLGVLAGYPLAYLVSFRVRRGQAGAVHAFHHSAVGELPGADHRLADDPGEQGRHQLRPARHPA